MARTQTVDRTDHIAEARTRLEAATLALSESDAYKRHLRAVARFHRYSWGNCALILAQREDASYVAGFQRWLELGRAVRKGERAIRILAPRPFRRTVTNDAGDEEEIERVGYGTACVFDIAQTEPIPGHPHPFDMPAEPDVAGDEETAARCYAALVSYLVGRGVAVQSEDDGGAGAAGGWYRPGERRIYVRPGAPAKMLKTLVHEAAHHLADGHADIRGQQAAEEIIAESIAFVICDAVGIDAGDFSTDYLAHWLQRDPAGFRKGQAFVADAARQLLAALDASADEGDAGETVAA